MEAKLIFSSIPTKFEAASLAKQLVAKNGVGDLVVDVKYNGETFPFARTDLYTMDCNNENSDHLSGSILLFSTSLGVTISSLLTNSQQAAFSLHENFDEYKQENSYQVVTKHRLTLVGNVEINLPKYGEPGYQEISECFFQKHPAARHWEGLGDFRFYRLVPEKLHYVGGFGNNHFIGWLDIEDYRAAPVSEICYEWGDACKKVAGEDILKKCCPMDDDNLMHECCSKFGTSSDNLIVNLLTNRL